MDALGDLFVTRIGLAKRAGEADRETAQLPGEPYLQGRGIVLKAVEHHRREAERRGLAHGAHAHLALVRDEDVLQRAGAHRRRGIAVELHRREIENVEELGMAGEERRGRVAKPRSELRPRLGIQAQRHQDPERLVR